jgi:hypothetical protein
MKKMYDLIYKMICNWKWISDCMSLNENTKKYHREYTNIVIVFRKEYLIRLTFKMENAGLKKNIIERYWYFYGFKKKYRTELAFKIENVKFKSIKVKILKFIWYSKIEIELIDFQNKSAELMKIYA